MPVRKKILHIILRTSYDGAAIFPIRIINELNEFDHQIVSCFKGRLYDEIKDEISCTHLMGKNEVKKYSIIKLFRFLLILFRSEYDIIHYHCGGIGLLYLSIWFRKKAKVIHHIHSGVVTGDNKAKNISGLQKILYRLADSKTIKIACAEHVYNFYNENIRSNRNLYLIENAVEKNNRIKKNLKYGIGYLGRITKEKGINLVFDLVNNRAKINNRLNFFMQGDVNLNQAEFQNFLKTSSAKYYTPHLEVNEFFSKIDILLFPSVASEALPLVVLEAVSNNVAVFVTKAKWSVEIFGDSYPLYFEGSFVNNNLVEKINEFYNDTSLRENIFSLYDRINKEYDFTEMITSIRSVYNENFTSK